MNYYETLYIIHPALDAGRVKEMVLSVNKNLEKTGGNIASIDVWGKKKLAYEIDKQKYGTYVLVQFKGDGSGNSNFNVELEHNPNILAYLTLKIEEHKISTQTLSLDEQIRGDNPSTSSKVDEKNQKIQSDSKIEKKEEMVSNKDDDKEENQLDDQKDHEQSDEELESKVSQDESKVEKSEDTAEDKVEE